MASKTPTVYSQEDITTALMCVIAWAGSIKAALRDLDDRGIVVPLGTLRMWVEETHAAEYQRLRDEHGHQLEQRLAHEFRDVARRAVEVQQLALEEAKTRLEAHRDSEPAKTASFAGRVSQSAVDKLMTLTNRPERITESRDVNEVLRSLAAKKVLVALPAVNGTATEVDPEREP